jgi:hypothetical protein
MRDPLVQFLLAGALLFMLYSAVQSPDRFDPESNEIFLPAAQIDLISANFARTWSRPPTTTELENLIDSFIREEIFYREALALGLDKNDPTVRRRMQQKLAFLYDDIYATADPSDQELRGWLDANADDYVRTSETTFQQIYLGADPLTASEFAAETLRVLKTGRSPEELGEPSLLPRRVIAATTAIVERGFGARFATELADTAVGEWTGPIRSTYGAHLVLVEQRTEARPANFDDVRDKLRMDFIRERRLESEELRYARMLQRYQVTIDWPDNKKTDSR